MENLLDKVLADFKKTNAYPIWFIRIWIVFGILMILGLIGVLVR